MPGQARAHVDDVAAALIEKLGPMEAWKLQKLLYYAQGWYLAITGNCLFGQQIQAWQYGPVVPVIWREHAGRRQVSAWPAGNSQLLDFDVLQLLDLVCTSYGHLSGDDLSHLTHNEAPWRDARGGLGPDEPSAAVITNEALKSYFLGRELAGHTTADLAAAGLHLPAAEHDAGLASTFAEVRQEFSGPATDEPGDGNRWPVGSAPDPEVTARLAERRARRTAS